MSMAKNDSIHIKCNQDMDSQDSGRAHSSINFLDFEW